MDSNYCKKYDAYIFGGLSFLLVMLIPDTFKDMYCWFMCLCLDNVPFSQLAKMPDNMQRIIQLW